MFKIIIVLYLAFILERLTIDIKYAQKNFNENDFGNDEKDIKQF